MMTRRELLESNVIDLETELTDLAQEIEWRVDRVREVRRLLRLTRWELLELMLDDPA